MPKITADKVREMQAWCAKSGVTYIGSESSYGSAVRMAIKNRNRAPNGVLYYFPRLMPNGFERSALGEARRKRAYVLWAAESVDAIEEACAFIVMGHNRNDIFLIRISTASQAAMEIENAHN